MKRAFFVAGSIIGGGLLGGLIFVMWASSGQVSNEHLAQMNTYPASPASPEQDTFTVMTHAVNYRSDSPESHPSRANGPQGNLDDIIRLIQRANPDFIGLQEVNFGADRSSSGSVLDTLATRLGHASGAQAISWNKRYLPSPFAPSGARPGSLVAGPVLLSRFPLRQQVREELPAPREPVLGTSFSPTPLAQVTVADIGGWPLILINVQFSAADQKAREKQARRVNALFKPLARRGFPIILLGSMNSVRLSALSTLPPKVQRRFSKDKTMELLLDGTSLTPAFSEGAYVTGANLNTYPASDPTQKLDYIFYTPRLIVPINAEVLCADASRSADHCAVTMSFLLPRPEKKLPKKRIPDKQLPSLDSLMSR